MLTNNKEGLSVITPYNGSSSFIYFLKSFLNQSLNPELFELIIVQQDKCDCSDIIKDLNQLFKLKVYRYTFKSKFDGHSAGVLRNYGASKAKFDRLVFIDSDCLLHPDCLLRHYYSGVTNNSNVLCGSMKELPARKRELLKKNTNIFSEKYADLIRPDYREVTKKTKEIVKGNWEDFYSSNVSISKNFFSAVDGFDEKGFRCHDMDLGYRLNLINDDFYYDPQCYVIHVDHIRSVFYRKQQILGWKNLATKHPELAKRASFRIDAVENSYQRVVQRVVSYLRELKLKLAVKHSCFLAGNYIIIEEIPKKFNIETEIKGLAYEKTNNNSTIRYQLQIDRDCWDYGLIIPKQNCFQDPQFSIIITVYNSRDTIKRALESVFCQTFQSFEIIVVDDFSTDNSLLEIQDFHLSKRLKTITNTENLGLSKSLNIGLSNAKGKYILQLDADDWLHVNALEKIYNSFISEDSDAVYGSPYISTRKETYAIKGWQAKKHTEYFEYHVPQAPRAYKKKVLLQNGGWDTSDAFHGRYYEDRRILAKIARSNKITHLNEAVYFVNEKHASLSRDKPLRAASAKLSIIINECNYDNKSYKFSFNGKFLHGKIIDQPEVNLTYSWSVIVPFQRDLDHLKLCIASWNEVIANRKKIEIIIVNNSGNRIAPECFPNNRLPIQIINVEAYCGPSIARNAGVKNAKNDFIFFCDEDHIVHKKVLIEHEKLHFKEKKTVIIGGVFGRRGIFSTKDLITIEHKKRVLESLNFSKDFLKIAGAIATNTRHDFIPTSATSTWKKLWSNSFTDLWLAKWGEIFLKHGFDLNDYEFKWLRVGTGNLSISKENFNAIGRFDESLKSMEDWELGIRLMKDDFQITALPYAEPFHLIHSKDPERFHENKKSIQILENKHPEIIANLIRSESSLKPPGAPFFEREIKQTVNPSPRPNDIQNVFCLTFDDGPHEYCTKKIASKLSSLNLKATFFMLGEKAVNNKELCKEIAKSGFEIGIHGWNHYDLSSLSSTDAIDSIKRAKNEIESIIEKQIIYFRPPYGVLKRELVPEIENLNLKLIGWDSSSRDWSIGITEQQIITELSANGVKSKIVLFHDGTGEPDSVCKVLDWMKQIEKTYQINSATVSKFIEHFEEKDLINNIKFVK